MATWLRFSIWIKVTIACAVAGVIHYQVGVAHLYPKAKGGPWSGAIDLLEYMVPAVLVILILGTGAWVIAGSVQEEQARVRRRPGP